MICEAAATRGKKFISLAMNILDTIVEARLIGVVRISEVQFGSMPGKSTRHNIHPENVDGEM